MADFNIGDLVYFRKYEREGAEQVFKPGSQAQVVEQTEQNGIEGFIVENKKGVRGFVVATELKLRAKPLKEQIQQALEKEEKQKATRTRKVSTTKSEEQPLIVKQAEREDKALERLMIGADGTPQQLVLTEELDNLLLQQTVDPLQLAKDLWRDVNASYYDLGGTLAYIYSNKKHRDYGYTGINAFNKFVDTEIPNMKSRKARYLLEIYVRFTNLGVNKEAVLDLGWTLASNIAQVATPENVYELIEYAKNNGGKALKVFIEENYKMRESVVEEDVILRPAEVGKMKHITLSIYEDQFKLYESAMEHLKTQYPQYEEKPSQLFSTLITEYLANLTAQAGTTTVEDYVTFGEAAFAEYEVLLVNRKTKQVFNPRYNQGEVTVTIAPGTGQEVHQELVTV